MGVSAVGGHGLEGLGVGCGWGWRVAPSGPDESGVYQNGGVARVWAEGRYALVGRGGDGVSGAGPCRGPGQGYRTQRQTRTGRVVCGPLTGPPHHTGQSLIPDPFPAGRDGVLTDT